MRGDDVVVDFDTNDVPYYALAGALADARATWVATIVFRLACAFWFACGCAVGRASAGWGPWASGAVKGTREKDVDAVRVTRTASGGYGEVERNSGGARGDGYARRGTRESKKKESETERTSSSVKRGDEKPSVSSTGTTGTRTTTNVAPMEVETNGNVEAAVEEEAESAFTCVDDEMEDAFVDESEVLEPTNELTTGFGSAPTRFETKEEVEESTREKTFEASSPSDEPTSAEDEEDESDSVETKEKMQFVADQVSEATSAMHSADDERSRARAEANKIEWEQRAVELAKQREEARRLKTAARKERRMKERTEAHKKEAEDRAKQADSLNEYRTAAQTMLKSEGLYFIAENGDLSSLLLRLGTHEDGKNIETSYKKALLKYHPDRSAARGGSLEDNARCEETFKLLQACRKLWENMGKPSVSFTRTQSAHTRSWTRAPGANTTNSTNSSSPPSNNAAYNAYQAGRRSAEAEERSKQAQANAEFVQKAKQEASEAESRMRSEAARRWRELQKMQRDKFTRESQAEMTRMDSLNKAREREELRKKLEEIKRSATFPTPSTDSPSSGKSTSSPTFNRTVSGTRVHVNAKPVTSPGIDSQQSGSPQSKEQTLHRL